MTQDLKSIIEEFLVRAGNFVRIRANVYKVIGTENAYCLKYYDSQMTLERLSHIIRSLKERKFFRCNQIIQTQSKKDYLPYKSGGWQLTTWINGKQPDFTNQAQLEDALFLLAKFHKAGEQIPFQTSNSEMQRYQSLYKQWEHRYNDLLEWHSEYKNRNLKKAIRLAEQGLEILQKSSLTDLAQYENTQQAIVHGDYNYPNLIRKKQGKLTIIDFENSAHDIRIRDLAHIIQRNVQRDINQALWMIRIYESKRPLTREERTVLAGMLAFPYQFWREFNIRKFYKKKITADQLKNWGNRYLSRHYSDYWKSFR